MTAPLLPAGQSHPLFTTAFQDVLRLRLAQVQDHGHTPEQDDRLGAHALVNMAHGATLKAAQPLTVDSAREQQMVGDQTMGHVAGLSDHDLAVAYRRLTKSAALNIAAMDIINRERDRRQAAQDAAE